MHTPTINRPQHLRFSYLLHSEYIKLTSLRVTFLALVTLLLVGLGASTLYALTLEDAGLPETFSVGLVLDGVTIGAVVFGQIIAGILGVLAITTEYSSGTIHPTFIAAPGRLRVLMAKSVVVFLLVTTTALVTVFGAWLTSYPFFAEFGLQATPATRGFIMALVGAGIYIGCCAIFGLGIGTLLRSAAGGSMAVIGATMLLPVFLSVLPPTDPVRYMRLYTLGHAGNSMAGIGEVGGPFADVTDMYLSPLGGWITAIAWAGITLVIAGVILRRRDV
ncbi:ABC transporter permease [Corynebacterium efficiens]|nr:ABC transporter permease [Corynebacterium efficiens]